MTKYVGLTEEEITDIRENYKSVAVDSRCYQEISMAVNIVEKMKETLRNIEEEKAKKNDKD